MKNVPFHSNEETLETLRIATEAAALGIWDCNIATGELHFSERARTILGLPAGEFFSYEDFLHGLDDHQRSELDAAIRRAFGSESNSEFEFEFRFCRPNQDLRWVYAKGKAIFEKTASGSLAHRMVGTLLDRTEQKLAQHALLQTEQLAATGRLAASIAHEINNPLESVTNLLYLARHEPDESQRNGFLAQAESELSRVSEIASNTLRFYRDPKGMTSVEVAGLMDSVLRLFHGRVVMKGIDCSLHCEGETHVQASQGELRQVFVNLVSNAIDAMPDGGRIQVRCRRFEAIGKRPQGVGICVADTGEGMTAETLKRVFEPFYTTKGSAGTGLGLWLSSEIIKKHGFKLRVKSKVKRGSVFSVFMPLHVGA